ncbi:hypothetical protein AMTRI_Chr06g196000 [Amborella trichopoda]
MCPRTLPNLKSQNVYAAYLKALASRANHCNLDGVAINHFLTNLASCTRGYSLALVPSPDCTIFQARRPPIILHPHFEYSKPTEASMLTFSSRDPLNSPTFSRALPPPSTFEEALQDGKIKRCTVFQVMVAKIWRARTLALGLPDELTSTVLFPIDVRKRMVPPLPANFAGNALVPGFARASARELREEGASFCVSKVQEGLERLFDAYVRSGIDWLEVHKGVPSAVDSFLVVSWLRLVMEGLEFEWAEAGCITPITVNTGLGGLGICLGIPPENSAEFQRIMSLD